MDKKFQRISSIEGENSIREAQQHSFSDYMKYMASGATGGGAAGKLWLGKKGPAALWGGAIGGIAGLAEAAREDWDWSRKSPKEKVLTLSASFKNESILLSQKLSSMPDPAGINSDLFKALKINISTDLKSMIDAFDQVAQKYNDNTLTTKIAQDMISQLNGEDYSPESTAPDQELPPLPEDTGSTPDMSTPSLQNNTMPPGVTPSQTAPTPQSYPTNEYTPEQDSTAPVDVGYNMPKFAPYNGFPDNYSAVQNSYASAEPNKFVRLSAPPRGRRNVSGPARRQQSRPVPPNPPTAAQQDMLQDLLEKFKTQESVSGKAGKFTKTLGKAVGKAVLPPAMGAGVYYGLDYLERYRATILSLLNRLKYLANEAIKSSGANTPAVPVINAIVSKLDSIIESLKTNKAKIE